MKTSLEINETLLEEVQKLLGTPTIKETVHSSLLFVKRQYERQALAENLGKIDIDLTPDRIRQQRRKRVAHVSR